MASATGTESNMRHAPHGFQESARDSFLKIMQGTDVERDVSSFNNPQNKFDDVLALAYNNCVAKIQSHV